MQTMKTEVEIISEENIKPSSPTPQHLKLFKISALDQLVPANYAHLILWFPPTLEIRSKIDSLKESLSNTLTHYYPLAGKFIDSFSIDCNDQGSRFLETRVNCTIKDFLKSPDLLSLPSFLPCDLKTKPNFVSNFQVNVFECGGISIGVCVAHKVCDGAALETFLRSWTAAARGCREIVVPNFFAYSSEFFVPANKFLPPPPIPMWLLKKGKSLTGRFVFDATAIAGLKSLANGGVGAKIPSRVEVVTALIWKSVMAASTEKDGIMKPSMLTHLVNLRRKISPPETAANSIGNLLLKAVAEHDPDCKSDFHALLGELREAFSKIKPEFVKKSVGDSSISEFVKEQYLLGTTGDEFDFFRVTSWCNFDYSGADFGWGKPIWVSSIGLDGMMFVNFIILIDTVSGDGVEAWVTVDEEEMAIMQKDPELLRFASVNPSPLKVWAEEC